MAKEASKDILFAGDTSHGFSRDEIGTVVLVGTRGNRSYYVFRHKKRGRPKGAYGVAHGSKRSARVVGPSFKTRSEAERYVFENLGAGPAKLKVTGSGRSKKTVVIY